jgi:choline dehydrogenase-like flavoprotein
MNSRGRPPFDAIIVGSGPAGVSAAFPLVDAGMRVLMVDGGEVAAVTLPDADYLDSRANDRRQWEWLVGRDFQALRGAAATSPKFRAPTLDYVFRGFAEANAIVAENFNPVGSLAVGGLSNAWGCGVARFSGADLADFPIAESELAPSFEAVARRIGISGRSDDDLADYFGVDAWAQPAMALDRLHEALLANYRRHRDPLLASGFRLGRARLAVLAEDAGTRRSCSRSGLCLWGCPRESLYTARYDLRTLAARPNFEHEPGFVVDRLEPADGGWNVCGRSTRSGTHEARTARRIVVAAGTLATTGIVMRSLPQLRETRLVNLPMAAFALWLPRALGAAREGGPGFAQLAFAQDDADIGSTCGFLFSTQGLPVGEFIRYAPLARRHSVRLFRTLLSSMVVANCFFPGHLSNSSMRHRSDGAIDVVGGAKPALADAITRTRARLGSAFRRAGAWLLPGSFKAGATGGDAHYAGSLPMRRAPGPGETSAAAEVAGLAGVFVADAAAMPSLPAKSHTLALMACADRVGRAVVTRHFTDAAQ